MKVSFEKRSRRKEIIAVHFGNTTEYRWAIPDGMEILVGDIVWVETPYGEDLAKVRAVVDSRGIARKEVTGVVTNIEVNEGISDK